MLLQVEPLSVIIGDYKIKLSMKCIPKSFLENNNIKDLKQICKDFVDENYERNHQKDFFNMIKCNNRIIFNNTKLKLDIHIEILNLMIDLVKVNFPIINKDLTIVKDNLFVFNLIEFNYDNFFVRDLIANCIELLHEQFIWKLEKRTANMLVRNYLVFRFDPKMGYCKRILNKQYDEYLVVKENLIPNKRIKLN